MNLNAKRQGVTPFSFTKPADDKSTITELQGLLESRHFTRLDICEGENKAIIFRCNLKLSVFRNIQFSSLLMGLFSTIAICGMSFSRIAWLRSRSAYGVVR